MSGRQLVPSDRGPPVFYALLMRRGIYVYYKEISWLAEFCDGSENRKRISECKQGQKRPLPCSDMSQVETFESVSNAHKYSMLQPVAACSYFPVVGRWVIGA